MEITAEYRVHLKKVLEKFQNELKEAKLEGKNKLIINPVVTKAISKKSCKDSNKGKEEQDKTPVQEKQQCQICFKLFKGPATLKKHLLNIHNYKFFKCHYCEERFSNNHSLEHHLLSEHVGQRDKTQIAAEKKQQQILLVKNDELFSVDQKSTDISCKIEENEKQQIQQQSQQDSAQLENVGQLKSQIVSFLKISNDQN